MQTMHIVVGTVTGTAQSVASYIRKQLSGSFAIQLHEYPDLNDITIKPNQLIVFCVSNTGDGELPPSMRKVYVQLTEHEHDMSGHEYLLINFGDRSFRSYGKSGKILDSALKACGAKALDSRLTLDAMQDRYPRQDSLKWLKEKLEAHGKVKFTAQ
jgi:flavodoxin